MTALTSVVRLKPLRSNVMVRLGMMAAVLLIWMVGFRWLVTPELKSVGAAGSFAGASARLAGAFLYSWTALLLYGQLVRWLERRVPTELDGHPGALFGAIGAVLGLSLFVVTILVIWLFGAATIADNGGNARNLVAFLAAAIMAAVGEEVLFRGVLLRILEQSLGTLAALLISALLFGLAHLVNQEATLLSSLVISLESGLLLGTAFIAARNLWFPIGIHLAWNFTQGGIFTISDSRPGPQGLVRLSFHGPDWLTGRVLVPDTSLVAITLCFSLMIAFAWAARSRKQWQPPRLKLQLN